MKLVIYILAIGSLLSCKQQFRGEQVKTTASALTDTVPYRIIAFDTTDQACTKRFTACPKASFSYPVFSGSDTALNTWLNTLVLDQFVSFGEKPQVLSPSEYVSRFLDDNRQTRAEFGQEDGPSWGWEQALHIRIFAWHGHYLSLSREWSGYTGGAHGNHTTDYLNVDLKNKALLKISDLLDTRDPKLKQLGEVYFRRDLQIPEEQSLKDAGYFIWDEAGDNRNSDRYGFYFNDNFAIGDSGISFLYNSYEIAAYASGVPAFTIPYAVLQPFLKTALN